MKFARFPNATTQAARSNGVETPTTECNNRGPSAPNSPANFNATFPPNEYPTSVTGPASRNDSKYARKSDVNPAWYNVEHHPSVPPHPRMFTRCTA